MNKLEVSIELSFDIDAGTIEPFDGELLQLFNDVEIGKLEIEYR